jgi:hypothetical protein
MRRLLVGTLAVVCASAFGQSAMPAQKPAPATPVTITNTPVPVTVQGGVSVGGNVTIGNTAQNPVPVAGSLLSGETTQLLSDAFYTVNSTVAGNSPVVGPIDVKDYKTIRVVLRVGACSNCGNGPIAFVQTMGTATSEARTIDKVQIDTPDLDIGEFASRTYDTLGTDLVIRLLSDKAGASYTVRAMVFGRAN